MITHEAIRHEIHELMERPMSRECLGILADLVYLDKHFPHFGEKEVTEMHAVTNDDLINWTKHMKNADGSTSPHWTLEQVRQVMQQHGITSDLVEFWVVMNMLYSDGALVAKRYNVDNPSYFADLAKAWLDDKDAHEDKLARYYKYISER